MKRSLLICLICLCVLFAGFAKAADIEPVTTEPACEDLRSLVAAGWPDISPQREASARLRVVENGSYILFTSTTANGTIRYRIKPSAGLESIEGQINNKKWIPLGKGFEVAVLDVGPMRDLISYKIANTTWIGTYRHSKIDMILTVKIDLSGGTLRVQLNTDQGRALNINLPFPDGGKDVDIPYLNGYEGSIKYLPKNNLFYSCLVDWTKTNSTIPVPRISYQADLGGKVARVNDLIAITLSDSVDKVLPSIPNPVSAYRQEIADRMVVEFWYGNFDRIGETLDMYHEYGMDNIVAIIHRWQRYGFDTKYPDIFPPDPQRGGLDTLRTVVKRAAEHGQKIALHENYADFYPEAPSWNEADLMRTASGGFQEAWATSKHCSPSKMVSHAQKVMPLIKKELAPNAVFLDVHSALAPWFRVDFRADVPYSAQMKGNRIFTNDLWEYARKNYGGPVFGEGCFSWVHAGCIDSVDAQHKETGRFFVDFALLKIRPQATNHGMGYYERWNQSGYEPKDWMIQVPSHWEMDDYRAAEVAFAHAANVGSQANRIIELVAKEYYLVRPLISRQIDSKVVNIAYHDGKKWLSSSEAIIADAQKVRCVRITYDNGLVVYVNRSSNPWEVDIFFLIGGAGFEAR